MKYFEINRKAIESGYNGFKMNPGGTGIGKTSAIIDLVKECLNYSLQDQELFRRYSKIEGLIDDGTIAEENIIKEFEQQFEKFKAGKTGRRQIFYLTNRHQLLQELFQKVNSISEGSIVYIKSNVDSIKESELNQLIENPIINKYSAFFKTVWKKWNSKRVARYIDQIKTENLDSEESKEKSSYVIGFFADVLKYSYRISQNKEDQRSIKSYNLLKSDYRDLVNNEIIHQLFPYIKFRYFPSEVIMLVSTIDKAYYGYFDGKRTVNLSMLKNVGNEQYGNNIIILDELDYLYPGILKLQTGDTEINDPFTLIRSFYENITRYKLTDESYMKNVKLYENNSGENVTVRQELISILEFIERINDKLGVSHEDFHFISRPEDLKVISQKTFLRARKIFTTKPLYINSEYRTGSIAINLEKDKRNRSLQRLLLLVDTAANRIVQLCKRLEQHYLYQYYDDFLDDAFPNMVNIKYQIKNYRQTTHNAITWHSIDDLYLNGFSLFEIDDQHKKSDPNQVKINYYRTNSSPEGLLSELSTHNLVIGLSATGEIPRILDNFDFNWIKKELKKSSRSIKSKWEKIEEKYTDKIISSSEGDSILRGYNERRLIDRILYGTRPNCYFTAKKSEENIIQEINKKKMISRFGDKPKIDLILEKEYNYPVLMEYLEGLNSISLKDDFNEFNYRKNRVIRFFKVMDKINKGYDTTETHLLFFDTFTGIEAFLESEYDENNETLFRAQKKYQNNLPYYVVTINNGEPIIVMLLNADLGRSINTNVSFKEDYYNLFWQKVPVVVVTQFKSASNGVNLQYFHSQKDYEESLKSNNIKDTDFKNVHILDKPAFFFNSLEPNALEEDRREKVKNNIFKIAKLYRHELIRENTFFKFLGTLSYSPPNDIIRDSEEGVLSTTALFLQCLGRVERTWNDIEFQKIYLYDEAFGILENFCTDQKYGIIFEEFKKIASVNHLALFEQILKATKKNEQYFSAFGLNSLRKLNEKSKLNLDNLVKSLGKVRDVTVKSDSLKEKYELVRQLILEAKWRSPLFTQELHSTFNCPYISEEGIVMLSKKYEIIPSDSISGRFSKWNLNIAFRIIRGNYSIRDYFSKRDYQLEFSKPIHNFIPTPYFYQAYVIPTIAEEATRAIFRSKGFNIDTNVKDEVYEFADLKLKDLPIFIDSKHYSTRTILSYDEDQNDLFVKPYSKLKEEKFEQLTLSKLSKIKELYGNEAKLIYLNLVETEDFRNSYFTSKFEEVSNIHDADIIKVNGILKQTPDNPIFKFNETSKNFDELILLCEELLNEKIYN